LPDKLYKNEQFGTEVKMPYQQNIMTSKGLGAFTIRAADLNNGLVREGARNI